MDELWDIARVAEHLGVSQRTVYNKVRSGELPAIRVGRLWRVRAIDLEAWLAGSTSAHVRGPYPHRSAEEPIEAIPAAREDPGRQQLEHLLAPIANGLARRLAFVGLLSESVEALGWPAPVVVGGHAVEFHTAGDYATVDIDLAGASEPVADVLSGWGFRRQGRHWYDEDLSLLVEVPGGTLSPEQLAHVTGVRIAGVTTYVLGIEDLIVDRLAACAFWKDEESCLWAQILYASADEMDQEYLGLRAAEESLAAELQELVEAAS